mmetsp:Transcript_28791/g.60784  ORF Transcript_28791/g.60784 Transcript_28791/m.60784 type:complete len:207 (+) Transcript_28791:1399-2019(+)
MHRTAHHRQLHHHGQIRPEEIIVINDRSEREHDGQHDRTIHQGIQDRKERRSRFLPIQFRFLFRFHFERVFLFKFPTIIVAKGDHFVGRRHGLCRTVFHFHSAIRFILPIRRVHLETRFLLVQTTIGLNDRLSSIFFGRVQVWQTERSAARHHGRGGGLGSPPPSSTAEVTRRFHNVRGTFEEQCLFFHAFGDGHAIATIPWSSCF